MKKTLKIFFAIFTIFLIVCFGLIFYAISITADCKLDNDKLINLNHTVTFYDNENNLLSETSNGTKVTEIDKINKDTINAFIAIEDKRFYSHSGIDYKRLLSATINNIKSTSFKEGGSTISQQLIKNTHFSSEKTIKRKLGEIKLAKELEKNYTKEQIIEKYLNTIYFGENCYGITNAAKRYFNKDVLNLSLNESAVLAAIIKAPSNYSPFENPEKCLKRKDLVLKTMLKQDLISENVCNKNLGILPKLNFDNNQQNNTEYDYLYFSQKELKEFYNSSPYASTNLKVYTNCDSRAQGILKNSILENNQEYFSSAILIDKNSKVCAYYSNCGDINRQLGSTIKPIISYAPAIEEGLAYPYTHIIDEKTDFNGYSPSNYNDIYYGKTTVKKSLKKSMNVCAVKLLNYVGVNKAKTYAKKTGLNFSENDNGLCLALGASEYGDKLSNICSAYTIFLNGGQYCPAYSINDVAHGKETVKKYYQNKTQVFSKETTSFINDMLLETVSDGTARKLSFLNFPIYAKTGTVGNESGNTDAYTISYTSDYILGVWIGNREGTLLPNEITGGSLPAQTAADIWSKLYCDKSLPNKITPSDKLQEIDIDKISYENDDLIILADENAPERYVERIIINKNNLPKEFSTRFSSPKIKKPEISLFYNRIEIRLCLTELYGAEIFKVNNGEKILIKDIANNKELTVIDDNVLPNQMYQYIIIPYYKNGDKKIYGEEMVLDKIKSPNNTLGENWWNDLI